MGINKQKLSRIAQSADLAPLEEFVGYYGIGRNTASAYCRNGVWKATKIGRKWFVSISSVMAWEETQIQSEAVEGAFN